MHSSRRCMLHILNTFRTRDGQKTDVIEHLHNSYAHTYAHILVSLDWTLRQTQQANLLRKQYEKQKGISYDLVVRARLDSFFENTIPDKEIQEALDQDTLFVGCNCSEKNYIHTETTDVFAFAKGPIMDIYSDTFNLYNDGKNRDLLGERGLHRQLTNHNIQTKWSNMRMKLPTVWTSTEIAASGFFN